MLETNGRILGRHEPDEALRLLPPTTASATMGAAQRQRLIPARPRRRPRAAHLQRLHPAGGGPQPPLRRAAQPAQHGGGDHGGDDGARRRSQRSRGVAAGNGRAAAEEEQKAGAALIEAQAPVDGGRKGDC